MQFEADFYDGISARAKRVLVTIHAGQFLFETTATQDSATSVTSFAYQVSDCYIQAKLGSGKRFIDLPDDGRLETDFQEIESHLTAKPSHGVWRFIHYAENHKVLIFCSLIAIVLASVVLVKHGVPVLAKYAAMAIPASAEHDLGKQTLLTLDQEKIGYFSPSELSQARQQSLLAGLQTMCSKTHDCPNFTLNFRKSPVIGANAFALPGGYIVMTDELVALAANDDEIIAVLAHEMGHVQKRHALRQTLQGTLSGLIIIAITGDVSSVAAGLPTLMMNMHYTRELETEADNFALANLRKACMPTKAFATILLRLEASHGGTQIPEMLSSHPDTKARVAPFFKHTTCG